MRSTQTTWRVSPPGSLLRMLVLARGNRTCVGIDLDSGAFVRAGEPHTDESTALDPFDVAEAYVADVDPDDTDEISPQPEYVAVETPMQRVGALRGRGAERLLRPLLHPPSHAIFGFTGPATPWWECAGDRPSITLVQPETRPTIVNDARGLGSVFRWGGVAQWLPIADRRCLVRLAEGARHPSGAMHIEDLLGFRPTRVVVALTRPRGPHCYKVAVGFLPKP